MANYKFTSKSIPARSRSDRSTSVVASSSAGEAVDLSGYLTVAEFKRYFELVDVAEDGADPVYMVHVVPAGGLSTNGTLSANGLGDEPEDSAGLDEAALKAYLDQYGYATQSWANSTFAPLGSAGGGLDEAELGAYLSQYGYATQSWVNQQGFLISHQSLSGYATQIWVNGQGFATQTWVANQGYLTQHQSLAGYATETWVKNQDYMTTTTAEARYVTLGTAQTISGQKTYGSLQIFNEGIKIGSALLTYDSVNQCLKVDKAFSSDDALSAKGVGDVPVSGDGGNVDLSNYVTQNQLATFWGVYGGSGLSISDSKLSLVNSNGVVLSTITLPSSTSGVDEGAVLAYINSYAGQELSVSGNKLSLLNGYGGSISSVTLPSGSSVDLSGYATQEQLEMYYRAIPMSADLSNGQINFTNTLGYNLFSVDVSSLGGSASNTSVVYFSGSSTGSAIVCVDLFGSKTIGLLGSLTKYNTSATVNLGTSARPLDAAYFASVTATSVTQTSDMRYKEVIADLPLAIEQIADAPIFQFVYTDGDSTLHAGTSAQYWQTVLPEVIHGYEDDKLTMEYGTAALMAGVVNAREVIKLRGEVARLTAIVEQLTIKEVTDDND